MGSIWSTASAASTASACTASAADKPLKPLKPLKPHYKAKLYAETDDDDGTWYWRLQIWPCPCDALKHEENVEAARYYRGIFNSDGTSKPEEEWVYHETDGRDRVSNYSPCSGLQLVAKNFFFCILSKNHSS